MVYRLIMSKKNILMLSIIVSIVGTASCSNNSINNPDPNLTQSIEAAVTVVSSLADDAATGQVGVSSLNNEFYEAENSTADDNTVDNNTVNINEFACTNAWSGCSSVGVKSRSTSCTDAVVTYLKYTKDISMSFFNANGSVDAACVGLATTNNYVKKTGTETLAIPIDGYYNSTSAFVSNYNGTSIGGGSRIIKNADATLSVIIDGVTKIHSDRNNIPLWSQTVRTDPSAPLVLNQLNRNGRNILSGTIIVDHNTANFTTTMVFSNVTYTSGCCYPTGGTVTITVTGSRTETDTLAFSSTCDNGVLSGNVSGTVLLTTCSSSIN